MRRICFLTGSRGEWGYIRPLLRLIDQDPEMDYQLIATHMHLLPEFGMSVNLIEQEGFRVHEKIYMTLDGYNSITMTKSLAGLLAELPGAFNRLKPDIILLAGDRGEQLMGAIAGGHMSIPVAHIQAGELSGNIDGIVRHSITKLAHIHFAANQEFADRVLKMGEQSFRVFNTGAPQLDELVNGEFTNQETLRKKYHLNSNGKLVLAVQHPVTEEESDAGSQIKETLKAIAQTGWPAILIYPNADAGSELLRAELNDNRATQIRMVRNLPREDYLGLMRIASVMVGNSSSAILEAPTFGLPAVNIGRRQSGRPQAENIINCAHDQNEIFAGLQKAASPEFLERLKNTVNPYGDGNSSGRIKQILKEIVIDQRLLNKEMTY
jgi:UDP-hydrolysing UDP-N-acetyl-D-glucosamine 2-epimerase